MKSLVALLFGILTMTSVCGQAKKYVTVKRAVRLMGSPFELTVVAQNEEIGYINLQEAIAEVKRVEKLNASSKMGINSMLNGGHSLQKMILITLPPISMQSILAKKKYSLSVRANFH